MRPQPLVPTRKPYPQTDTHRLFDSNQSNLVWAGGKSSFGRCKSIIIRLPRPNKSKAYKNAQLFCACHRYSDDHAYNFVGTI
jgi:hypothetical protein